MSIFISLSISLSLSHSITFSLFINCSSTPPNFCFKGNAKQQAISHTLYKLDIRLYHRT